MLPDLWRELALRPTPVRRGWDASHATRAVLAATSIGLLVAASNMITPLFPYLGQRMALGNGAVAMAFVAYVLPVVLCLPLVGHWSEYMGRRVVLVLSLVISLAGTFILLAASALAGVLVARALQGVAVALATAAAAAALRDLLPGRLELCARITLLVNVGACAVGPLAGGLLAGIGDPIRTPFVTYLLALSLLLVLLVVLRARPPVQAPSSSSMIGTLRPPRPSVPAHARHPFLLASVMGFLSFAVFGFVLSVAPGFYASVLDESHLMAALPAALLLGSSGCAQLMPVRGRHKAAVSLVLMAVGLVLMVLAGHREWLIVLFGATVTTGLAQGVAFRTLFTLLGAELPPTAAARTISLMYMITYLGSALPVLALGFAMDRFGAQISVTTFLLVVAGIALVFAISCLRYKPTQCCERGLSATHLRRAGESPHEAGCG